MLREEQGRVHAAGLRVVVWGTTRTRAPPNHSLRTAVLYIRGALEAEDEAAVAIVGSRRATAYGEEMAGELARELAGAG